MNAEQCKAICDKIDAFVYELDELIWDQFSDLPKIENVMTEASKVHDAIEKMTDEMRGAWYPLYMMLTPDEQRKFDLL